MANYARTKHYDIGDIVGTCPVCGLLGRVQEVSGEYMVLCKWGCVGATVCHTWSSPTAAALAWEAWAVDAAWQLEQAAQAEAIMITHEPAVWATRRKRTQAYKRRYRGSNGSEAVQRARHAVQTGGEVSGGGDGAAPRSGARRPR